MARRAYADSVEEQHGMRIGGEYGGYADGMQHCKDDDRLDHPVILAHESWVRIIVV